ncbi:MAG: penicillin-binding protein 1C [Hyphomicrobiales bacterium]|nr:penicillin-binding protein 1C [Hyphomicrobiales bacterium]
MNALRAIVGVALAAGLVTGSGIAATWRAMPPLDLAEARERSVTVSDRHGRLLRAFTTDEGRWRLPLNTNDVDPRFLALLKAYEDRRFDSHHGVDPVAIARAGWQMLSHGRIVSGGSTLSMQAARLIEPRGERSLGLKLRQALRAIELERRYSKREILDIYLALAPYGGNLEGLRAATWSYFGKEPKRLTLAERALLVALPQSPETRRPDRHAANLTRVRDAVITRAVTVGLATPEEAEQARAEHVPQARQLFPVLAAHAAERAVAEQPTARQHRLNLDAVWQASLEALARERIEPLGPKLAGAILVIEHATGKVRAHVGGLGLLNRERAGALDLAQAVRSPGSALKPFIYALAFEQGIAHPETMLEDRPNRFGAYAPENFDLGFQGNVTARTALQQSLNLPAIELLAEVGPQRLMSRLSNAGGALVLPKDGQPGLALGLGGVGIRLADLARLYAGLARGGETIALQWREDRQADPDERRLTDQLASWYVGDVLRGAPAPANALNGRIAYKTGTSYGYRDAWAIGYDRRHTIAVWVGRPDNASVPGLVARQVAAPILFDAFARIGMEPDVAPAPTSAIAARTSQLPPPLRHIRRDIAKTESASARPSLRIAFPPDGAVVDLAGTERALSVKALGGTAPLTWLIDGAPVAQGLNRRDATLPAAGAGFARLSVIDSSGASDSVTVRLQ